MMMATAASDSIHIYPSLSATLGVLKENLFENDDGVTGRTVTQFQVLA